MFRRLIKFILYINDAYIIIPIIININDIFVHCIVKQEINDEELVWFYALICTNKEREKKKIIIIIIEKSFSKKS